MALPSCERGGRVVYYDVPSGYETRPVPRGCQGFDVRPGEARAVRVYPDLSFEGPVAIVRHPSDAFYYVVEQRGTVKRFVDRADAREAELVADLRGVVKGIGYEDGLLGLAFDPAFATTGGLVLKYTAPTEDPTRIRLVIAHARSFDGGATLSKDSIAEILSIERPADASHHGGPPGYGRDGMLYVPVGDGGLDGGALAQDPTSLAGKILRIDVSKTPYGIPPDNPFAATKDARPEIFALGLRNPHGWSFDPDEPALWVGDVGLHSYEEVNRVRGGENFGWPIREGAHCKDDAPCDATGLVDPVHEYVNFGGGAIVGGPVYGGARFPWLRGQLVFADFVSGRIEHIPRAATATTSTSARLLVESGKNVTSFSVTPEGELLFADHVGGLWSVETNVDGRTVPATLGETGCVDMTRPTEAPPGLVPYSVAMPLWSDGTEKTRFMAVPDGATIRVGAEGDFEMPVGSVLVKTFLAGAQPVETRLLVRHADGEWGGYTYEWTDDGRDATLLENGKVKDVAGKPHTFPSRAQCVSCHTPAAGFTLGLHVAQLNHSIVYADRRRANQLATLDHVGLFEEPIGEAATLPRFPAREDTAAAPEEWARAYLHANCSHCHRPGGPGRGNADLRFSSPLAETGCDSAAFFDVIGREDARVIVPGDPDGSVLVARMRGEQTGRMPPLATSVVDERAVQQIRAWIKGIDSCAPL
ncbi:MAG: PQQ-dependent sugar dehydrogenase [Labilithrix sp.]|nr:PQQ-dependent sugar dehydrogenase [Labilithrix sp.]